MNLVIFEGWLLMMRFLINNNPSSTELLFQSLNRFLFNLKNYLQYLKSKFPLFNNDCFFKLITCIQVTLEQMYNTCNEYSTFKSQLILLKSYLLIVKTISKINKKNSKYENILRKFNHLCESSKVVK